MTLVERVSALAALGDYLKKIDDISRKNIFEKAAGENPWFTNGNLELAWSGVISFLDKDKLEKWVSTYPFSSGPAKKVGLVMAGNIPMVGFHDLLCVLIAGHRALVKTSSNDQVLIKFIIDSLSEVQPLLGERVEIADRLKATDAVIATGSDNSSRYFEYYFSKIPHIIRKNRTSCAILTGEEHPEDLIELGEDIFSYFGMGCRNVSKLFIPQGYDITKLLDALQSYSFLLDHNKYRNNYDYHKSILLLNREPHMDAGFSLFRESKEMVSPLSVIFYESFKNEAELSLRLIEKKDKIQAIASYKGQYPASHPFGTLQKPALTDYADGVDTLHFLSQL